MGQGVSTTNARRRQRSESMPRLRNYRSFTVPSTEPAFIDLNHIDSNLAGISGPGLDQCFATPSNTPLLYLPHSCGSHTDVSSNQSRLSATPPRRAISKLTRRWRSRQTDDSASSCEFQTAGIKSMLRSGSSERLTFETCDALMMSHLDPDAVQRANNLHDLFFYVQRSNYVAPLVQPKRVLDVGCGTGRWVKEMARQFPKSRVHGCEVLPIYMSHDAPKNAYFELANMSHRLPYSDGYFDYVHLRYMALDVLTPCWPHLIAELFRVCKPGGWVEICETDGMVREPSPTSELINSWLSRVAIDEGVQLEYVNTLDTLLASAGFHNVTSHDMCLPLGEWGEGIGTVNQRIYHSLIETYRTRLLICAGITDEYLDALLEEQSRSLEQYQSYTLHRIYIAQRPTLLSHSSQNIILGSSPSR